MVDHWKRIERTLPGSYAALQEAIRTAAPNTTITAMSWYGGSGEALAFGPALLAETSRIGEPGTAVISAHRDTHFAFLKDVVVGDRITITRDDGLVFTYRVTGTSIVDWNKSGIDRHASGFNLVHAELVK